MRKPIAFLFVFVLPMIACGNDELLLPLRDGEMGAEAPREPPVPNSPPSPVPENPPTMTEVEGEAPTGEPVPPEEPEDASPPSLEADCPAAGYIAYPVIEAHSSAWSQEPGTVQVKGTLQVLDASGEMLADGRAVYTVTFMAVCAAVELHELHIRLLPDQAFADSLIGPNASGDPTMEYVNTAADFPMSRNFGSNVEGSYWTYHTYTEESLGIEALYGYPHVRQEPVHIDASQTATFRFILTDVANPLPAGAAYVLQVSDTTWRDDDTGNWVRADRYPRFPSTRSFVTASPQP